VARLGAAAAVRRRCYARQPHTTGERLGGRERLTWASLSRYPPAVNRSELIKAGGRPSYSITANTYGHD
jgi:hypothetical protein